MKGRQAAKLQKRAKIASSPKSVKVSLETELSLEKPPVLRLSEHMDLPELQFCSYSASPQPAPLDLLGGLRLNSKVPLAAQVLGCSETEWDAATSLESAYLD